MSSAEPCPNCQNPLPNSAPEGLCPKCLWASLLAPEGNEISTAQDPERSPLASATGAGEPLGNFGDYELLRVIARGGMGIVYRARQISLQRVVALKMILTARLPGESDMRRFRAEAEAAASLEHPNIVPVFEVGEDEGHPYFTMKYIPGGSLANRISDFRFAISNLKDGEPAPAQTEIANRQSQIANLMAKVARAVHHAHQRGILHRDLKPSNILLDEHDEPFVTDFGLAKQIETDSELTLIGTVLGTPAYIAPEQAAGGSSLTSAVDVYSLGAIFYELLVGRPPFQADTPLETLRQVVEQEIRRPSSINRRVDRDLETICLKCLQKNPAHRYTSAEALAVDLERWQRHEPIRARRAGAPERAFKWTKRHPALAALLVLASIAPAVIIAVLVNAQANVLQERNIALEQEQKASDSAASARASAKDAIAAQAQIRRNLYAADMLLAENALDDGNLNLARRLVESYRPDLAVPGSTGLGTNAATAKKNKEIAPRNPDPPKAELQTDLRGFEWRHLWMRSQGDPHETLDAHSNAVYSVAFSPDSKRLASGDSRGKVKLWDVASRSPFATLDASDKPVVRVTFSRDGRALSTGDEAGGVKVWNLATREIVWRHEGRNPAGVQFSPTTNWIGVTQGDLGKSTNSAALVVDWTTGKEVFPPILHADFEAFSPDGKSALITRSNEGGTEVWDIETQKVVKTVREFNGSLVVPPDGSLFATISLKGIFLAHLRGANLFTQLSSSIPLGSSLAFSPDGTLLASGTSDQVVRLWNVADGTEAGRLLGHVAGVTGVAFSPDGKLLATSGMDHTVLLWPTDWKKDASMISNTWPSYVISPDGARLAGFKQAAAGNEIELAVWDTATLNSVTLRKSRKPPSPEFFSPDSRTLFARGELSTNGVLPLLRWDLSSPGNPPKTTLLAVKHTSRFLGSAATPDGSVYAVGQRGTDTISFWNPVSGEALGEMHSLPQIYIGAPYRFSPDGRKLISYSPWHELELLDRTRPQQIQSIVLSTDRISESAFSPDGKTLAVACDDQCIRVLDTATFKQVSVLRGHQQAVISVAFSPDGRTLASCGLGGVIKLWSWPARREAATLAHGSTEFCFVAFSPDGNTLIAGGWGQTQIFHVPSLAEIDLEP